ncbi:hypothetical protein [Fulvimarina endophytica]|uniref:hypothetical protein n=1 Tax=Fulvimarina endophytica TaxID=2293836 RepID=UPI001314C211|nr:hypothetical protein [Fulvimarina endophytica]
MQNIYILGELAIVVAGLLLLLYFGVWRNPYEIEKRRDRRRRKAERRAGETKRSE